YRPDIIVQLRPTSPLRPPGLVDQAIKLLISDEKADSVRSVTLPSQNPYKMWTVSEGELMPLLECGISEAYNAPRQSLPQTYWQTGHLDAFRARTVREARSLTGNRILPLMVDSSLAIDIDAVIHLKSAEEILAGGEFKLVFPRAASSRLLEQVRLLAFDFDGV